MAALWDEVGTVGAAATDTRASSAIALTLTSLDVVARISAASEVTLADLSRYCRSADPTSHHHRQSARGMVTTARCGLVNRFTRGCTTLA
jgi:hypothetical protein